MGVSLLSVESKKAPDLRTSPEQRGKIKFSAVELLYSTTLRAKSQHPIFRQRALSPDCYRGNGKGVKVSSDSVP